METASNIISHKTTSTFDLSKYQAQLAAVPNLSIPLEQAYELLRQLSEIEIGRFLLENKGLNGFATAYMIIHGPKKQNLSELESWLLNKAPVVLATRERFRIFQEQLQKQLKNDTTLASIPCGLMDDLLSLNYDGIENTKLVGIDLDQNSLDLALENVKHHFVDQEAIKPVLFSKQNAWDLRREKEFDVITSNGLNIYEHDDEKVVKLYKEFSKALKPEGILITSFLTPPPVLSSESTWKNFIPEDALKQKVIFADIIQAGWQAFRTESKTRAQLEKAGFSVKEVIYDSQGMFPTVVAVNKL